MVGATSNKETNTYVGYEKQPDGTIKTIIIGAKEMEIAAAEHQSIDAMLKAIREAVAAERGSPYSQEPSADFTAGNSQDPALATQAHPNDPKLGSEPKTIRAVIFLPIISR